MATSSLILGEAFWLSTQPVLLANPAVPTPGSDLLLKSGAAEQMVLFRTSGSQGAPKLVGLTREALLASAREVNSFLGATAQETWLRVLPSFHVGGLGIEARAWVAGARCVVDEEKWDAARFRERCATESIAFSSLVPTQVFDLVQRRLTAPSCMRAVVVGGGELRPMLWQQAKDLGWPVLASYGLTEAASQVATQSMTESDPSVFTVLPHWRTQNSVDGRLELSGPALASAYFTQTTEGTWHKEMIGEWLRTSDRAMVENGILRFVGRSDRIIKRLGELVDLNAMDRALADAAVQTGVYGRVRLRCEEDARSGCVFILECLTASEGEQTAQLLNSTLPPFSRVEEIRVVSDLRLSPLGKPML